MPVVIERGKAITRKECGDSRLGSSASFSRRLTSSQIRSVVRGLPVSFFVRPTAGRNQWPIVCLAREASRLEIGQDVPLQFKPHRDFPRLTPLLLEPQDILLAVMLEIPNRSLATAPARQAVNRIQVGR